MNEPAVTHGLTVSVRIEHEASLTLDEFLAVVSTLHVFIQELSKSLGQDKKELLGSAYRKLGRTVAAELQQRQPRE